MTDNARLIPLASQNATGESLPAFVVQLPNGVLGVKAGLVGTCLGRGQVNYNWSDIPPV